MVGVMVTPYEDVPPARPASSTASSVAAVCAFTLPITSSFVAGEAVPMPRFPEESIRACSDAFAPNSRASTELLYLTNPCEAAEPSPNPTYALPDDPEITWMPLLSPPLMLPTVAILSFAANVGNDPPPDT